MVLFVIVTYSNRFSFPNHAVRIPVGAAFDKKMSNSITIA